MRTTTRLRQVPWATAADGSCRPGSRASADLARRLPCGSRPRLDVERDRAGRDRWSASLGGLAPPTGASASGIDDRSTPPPGLRRQAARRLALRPRGDGWSRRRETSGTRSTHGDARAEPVVADGRQRQRAPGRAARRCRARRPLDAGTGWPPASTRARDRRVRYRAPVRPRRHPRRVAVPSIGVLALQGDVREHLRMLDGLGVRAVAVRRPAELDACDALVLPGGESTTMAKLARDLRPARAAPGPGRRRDAGARHLRGDDPARRPDRGRRPRPGDGRRARRHGAAQRVRPAGRLLRGRPRRSRASTSRSTPSSSGRRGSSRSGPDVEVLARVAAGEAAGRIVAVRQRHLLATSFHPEVGGDDRVHRLFVDLIAD